MKKRAVSSLLAVLAVVSFILPVLATEPLDDAEPSEEVIADVDPEKSFVYLDGVPQSIEYELRNDTTYITVSSFVSMVDPQAVVEEEDGVVTVSSVRTEEVVDEEGNISTVVRETLSMTISTKVPYIIANDRYLYATDITTVNDHVAVPIRKLALVYNLAVDYDPVADAALLLHVEGADTFIESGDSYYDEESVFWLSRIIYNESGNQIMEGKIAVGNVVMNRVNSPNFPDNIHDVLNQKNQFLPTSTLSKRTPNSSSVVAAKLVLDGAVVLPTALFFNMKGLTCYASKYRPYVTTIGCHDFFA